MSVTVRSSASLEAVFSRLGHKVIPIVFIIWAFLYLKIIILRQPKYSLKHTKCWFSHSCLALRSYWYAKKPKDDNLEFVRILDVWILPIRPTPQKMQNYQYAESHLFSLLNQERDMQVSDCSKTTNNCGKVEQHTLSLANTRMLRAARSRCTRRSSSR